MTPPTQLFSVINIAMIASAASRVLAFATALLHVTTGSQHDWLDELADEPSFQRGLRKYREHLRGKHRHGHLRASARHSISLVHHHQPADLGVAAPRMDWHPDDASPEPASPMLANADDIRRQTAEAINAPKITLPLPGRHPSVEKVLDGMTVELHALKEKQVAESDARNRLQSSVGEAESHMNDAIAIKQSMAQRQAQLRLEQSKMKMLEYESQQVETSHTSLLNSLHRVLQPKLIFARERLLKKERQLEEDDRAVVNWRNKKDQIKQSAVNFIKGRESAKEKLLQVEDEMVEMKRKEEQARRAFERQRQRASDEVQSYQYADTKFKAEVAHEVAAKDATLAAKESLEKLDNVMSLETRKVDESMLIQKHRIEARRRAIEAARERSSRELQALEEQYREWKENQQKRAAEVLKRSQDTMDTSEAYATGQKQVLDSAEKKVVKDAVAKSDWAWDNDFSQASGSAEAGLSD